MKQVYPFIDNSDNVYGEFILYQDGDEFYWYTEEDRNIKHGPFSTEIQAYNDAQGYD